MQVLSSEGGSRYCNIMDEKGNSLLHIAARDGDQQFVRLLIQVLYNYVWRYMQIVWIVFESCVTTSFLPVIKDDD